MHTRDKARKHARTLAEAALARQDPTGWFEELYAQAEGRQEMVPWVDGEPNPGLVEWFEDHPGQKQEALVVACGLGDDAQLLAAHGSKVTAFDIAPTAVEWCRRRFPDSSVTWLVADLFKLPSEWKGRFNFIFEANTLQSLPADLRPQAQRCIMDALAPGGELLVLCLGRDAQEEPGELPPWPLTRGELDVFRLTLHEESFLDYHDEQSPPIRRFRTLYRRPK